MICSVPVGLYKFTDSVRRVSHIGWVPDFVANNLELSVFVGRRCDLGWKVVSTKTIEP